MYEHMYPQSLTPLKVLLTKRKFSTKSIYLGLFSSLPPPVGARELNSYFHVEVQ